MPAWRAETSSYVFNMEREREDTLFVCSAPTQFRSQTMGAELPELKDDHGKDNEGAERYHLFEGKRKREKVDCHDTSARAALRSR